MKVGSLFSGIGGIDLGLERAGMKIVWQVEKDPYCQKVLKKHWPTVPCYGDIKEIDFRTLPAVDLICGGFPCQPVSCAGKRQGDKDERWLWPEFYRAICEARPRWVLVENVPGLLSADDGRLFGGILGDLARCGYDAEWDLLPAAAFGAPHLRYRVFLAAYSSSNGLCGGGDSERRHRDNFSEKRQSQEDFQAGSVGQYRVSEVLEDVPDALSFSSEKRGDDNADEGIGRGRSGNRGRGRGNDRGVAIPRQDANMAHSMRIFKGRDSLRRSSWAGWWEREPAEVIQDAGLRSWERDGVSIPESLLGRVAHGIPSRVDRLKCLGNAVVPQVAEWIGRRILEVYK